MIPTSSITHAQGGLYELSLKGLFPHPHWIAFLFTGLAESQISVVSGRAARNDNLSWDARLMLDFARSKATPETLDYVALAQRKPAQTDMVIPRLSRFETLRRRIGNGAGRPRPDRFSGSPSQSRFAADIVPDANRDQHRCRRHPRPHRDARHRQQRAA